MTVAHLRDKLHVVTMISNPVRYKSRYRLYKQFAEYMNRSGVIHFHTVEIQNGERAFAVTDKDNPYHIQLRTEDELWHKENAINLCMNRFTPKFPEWKYMAWIDADVEFQRPDWIDECLHQLQVNHWIQMFRQAIDMGPSGEAMYIHNGYIYSYWHDLPKSDGVYSKWHSGYAWAATREALNGVGGLVDRTILGSADYIMASCLVGRGAEMTKRHYHPNYKHMILSWQDRAERYVKRDVGYMDGILLHYFHGKKKDRKYSEREQILVKEQYDPYKDIYHDWQGLYRLEDDRIKLRDDIKKYFRHRNEDSIDAE